jgi:putative ABC transport system permease protein
MGRLVRTQRTQVAVMQALGYGTADLVLHFLKLALLVALLGAAIGIGLGLWFAHGMVGLYQQFYSFPELDFSQDPFAIVTGLAVSVGFSLLGTFGSLRAVARLDPAEGMRPESPKTYKRTLLERMRAVWSRLGIGTRMILRHIARTKARTAVTVMGVAMATSLLVLAFFGVDATEELMHIQFRMVERQDARVAFHNERGRAALYEIRRIDGVRSAEPELGVPVRFRNGWRTRRSAITGLQAGQQLHGLLDENLRNVEHPPSGLLLSRKLAELLGVEAGDLLDVEVLNGKKPRFRAPVATVVDEYLGTFAYADIGWLSRRLGEELAMTGALLRLDSARTDELGRELKNIPAVAGVALKSRTIQSFQDTLAQSQSIMNTTMILFAGVIVFGVLYNAARISLAERERELGSLRVLGYTNREVSFVLAGENLLLVVLGVAPGIGLGAFFCWTLTEVYDTDLFRFPFVLRPDSIFTTIVVVVVFALLANVAVLRRLRTLDIVEVLKARE